MKESLPLISVITVCRNCETSIEATMNSVLNQTYKNIEYVIIDGLSTDRTFQIVDSYKAIFEQNQIIFTCLSEKDQGIYDAMNKGISIASGEWLIFMNSGDSFHDKNVIQCVFDNIYLNNEKIIYGNTLTKNAKTIIKPPERVTKKFFFAETICHQSIFLKKEVFKEIGVFDLKFKIIADREWLLKAIISKVRFVYVNIVISIWDEEGFSKENIPIYIKENNILRTVHFSMVENFFAIWRIRFLRFLKKL